MRAKGLIARVVIINKSIVNVYQKSSNGILIGMAYK